MAIPLLDNEFMQYWSKLTVVEKESLLIVARNYVQAKTAEIEVIDVRRELIRRERENYLHKSNASFSWEEVKALALDKSKRNVL